ncbi:Zn-dependent hydrolase [Allopusillimonas soli]|uniref:Zn-dependent hydrolase n=1 Tax=Allopusillimonas soli TaxID=659016 RepID=A0A853FAL3_9BURK|nr:Zn-dependent hydrolase [Allopusillimonas soli]NYT37143.1 Zn-dependent hydrolase [Allopusillimonas soli]TEA75569.1 Zn-dependent hydrolase [Allopusillimonas soli]
MDTVASKTHMLRIDSARLWDSLMALARIGATPKGGVCRLALTDLDRQGRDLFVQWAREAGCEVRVDQIGNIFARRAGVENSLPPVMMGSHIDTQPTGGKFDGNFGVLGGLEVVRRLNDAGIRTLAPIEVVAWTNEEGSRFVPVMMGSGVFAGAFGLEDVLPQQDTEGKRVGDELRRIGYAGSVPAKHFPIKAYFEAHIEQGPILEATDTVIGVVKGALGQRWYDVTVTGMEAHAGPTPMDLRKDALLASARLITAINQIALDHAPDARSTVGWIDAYPNSRNVIPGTVKFSVDLRAADDDVLDAMDAALAAACRALAEEGRVDVQVKQVVYFPPQPFDETQVQAVRCASERLSLPHRDIVSGAGHDAVYLARVTPTAMIFIPCKDGISHNEIEEASQAHVEAGCNVLLHAVLEQAGVAPGHAET